MSRTRCVRSLSMELLSGVLGSVARPLLSATQWLWRKFGHHVAPRWQAARRLKALTANVQVDRFNSVLGPPLMRRTQAGLIETVYVLPLFYVQAIADQEGQVQAFSVTARGRRFQPEVPFPNGGSYWEGREPIRASLNRTTFAEMSSEPTSIAADVGARRYWYTECYYFGNPANYQTVALSVNQAAVADAAVDLLIDVASDPKAAHLHAGTAAPFRQKAKPNTYTLSAPFVSLADQPPSSGWFGVDVDQVRLLD